MRRRQSFKSPPKTNASGTSRPAAEGSTPHAAKRPARRPDPRPPITEYYAEVFAEGATHRLRIMQRELATLPVVLAAGSTALTDFPPGTVLKVKLTAGSLPDREANERRKAAGSRPAPATLQAEIMAVLGEHPAGLASLVAIANHRLPLAFPLSVLDAAEQLLPYRSTVAVPSLPAAAASLNRQKTSLSLQPSVQPKARTDWRQLPIVTIDGADARDFDDAVWAEPTPDGGHHVIVAIADVAYYLQPNDLLDLEGKKRGNSTYLPDRVIPMLPERLSNDLCSLRPHEDRPVLGVEMTFDAAGHLVHHRFHRAIIYSAARLTYEQVQAALDGHPDATTTPLLGALKNLENAYLAREKDKKHRGALDLDLSETTVRVDATGKLADVGTRPRLTAHKLIEELMIAANVAAAEVLAKQGKAGKMSAGIYRIHDKPEKVKQLALKSLLGPLGFTVPASDSPTRDWARLATQIQHRFADAAPDENNAASLMKLVLQSQQQARYSPDNIGHFGLALPLYSHFTSPIRRYSDLVVHRALIACLKLPGWEKLIATPLPAGAEPRESSAQLGLPDHAKLADLGEHLALTERSSQKAEWEARDRLLVEFYQSLLQDEQHRPIFRATVTGVQAFGLFVSIPAYPEPFVGPGVAEGLVPARLLGGSEYWTFHAGPQLFQCGKQSLGVGSRFAVRLIDADRAAGRLTFARVTKSDETPRRERPRHEGRRDRRSHRQ